jgi:hypothetical protein
MKTFFVQILVAGLGGLFLWAFIGLKSMPGNIVDFGLFGIAIIDTIILTVLISLAMTCFVIAISMFKEYSE